MCWVIFYRKSYSNFTFSFFFGSQIHDVREVRISRVLNLFSIGWKILLDEGLNFSTSRRTSRSSPWPQSCVPKTSWSAGRFFLLKMQKPVVSLVNLHFTFLWDHLRVSVYKPETSVFKPFPLPVLYFILEPESYQKSPQYRSSVQKQLTFCFQYVFG